MSTVEIISVVYEGTTLQNQFNFFFPSSKLPMFVTFPELSDDEVDLREYWGRSLPIVPIFE